MKLTEACSICEHLPRDLRCDSVQSLPEGFSRLRPDAPIEQDGPRECPQCGSVYDLSYRRSDPGGVEIALQRRVQDPCWDDLEHPVAYRRTDAAFALSQLAKTDLSGLLEHHRPEVREHALQGLLGLTTLPDRLEVRQLLQDDSAAVRALAVRLCWRQMKEGQDTEFRDWLARNLRDCPVDAIALLLGYIVHSEEVDREVFVPIIEQAVAHGDPELRKRAARGLAWLAEAGCEKPARIGALVTILLEDPEWEVRLSGLSALCSMVADWGEQSAQVLEALARALRDVKLRYSLVRAMGQVIGHHDISACLPSLIEIVLHDRSYSDDASRLICQALERGLERRELVIELLPGLDLADEAERGSVCVCYRTMVKLGWDLRPAYDTLFRRLTSGRASFAECDLAADLAAPLLVSARREDLERLESMLQAKSGVAGAVSRALATLARHGRDLTQVVPTLRVLLNGPDPIAREARKALDEHLRSNGGKG